MEHRNVDTIRHELEVATLKAANVQLQAERNHASIQALTLETEKLAGFAYKHADTIKKLDDELRAALKASGVEVETPSGQVIPMTAPAAASA